MTSTAPTSRLARIAPWLAGLWAATYLPLALLHLARDTSPPWTPTPASVLGSVPLGPGVALVAVLAALAGIALAVTVTTVSSPRVRRAAAWLLAAVGLVVTLAVADVRTLSFLGYGPMLILGALGIGPVTDPGQAVMVDSLRSLGSSLGGAGMLVTAALTLSRPGRQPRWWDAAGARRIGAWAVAVAVLAPVTYAVTRLAWAVGIPLGVRDEFLVELGEGRWAGLGLGLFAMVGALLTLGLVQRWGRVFWSWLPVVGGRAVPVALAVVPGVFVALVVTSGGLAFWGMLLSGHLGDIPGAEQDWAAWAPELLWPAWGVALAVATLAYRRGRTLS
ncbi:hypothetical protein GCM10023339_09700 [Alloalcanivorax gelatiniphagus]